MEFERYKETFEDDLQFVATKVADSLNMFCEIMTDEHKLGVLYGRDEFIMLTVTPRENNPRVCQLRLRTKDMAGTWDNVPVGFSKINESRGLLNDMKRAAKLSLKRNSLWYIDYQIKDTIGEQVRFSEVKSKKGYFYKIEFLNGYVIHLAIEKNDQEYLKPHDEAKLYYLADKTHMPISAPMTADECIMLLINIGIQTDIRMAEFISCAEQFGAFVNVTNLYRAVDECYDEVIAKFNNQYSMKVVTKNKKITAEILGEADGKTVVIDKRDFDAITDVCIATEQLAKLPMFRI